MSVPARRLDPPPPSRPAKTRPAERPAPPARTTAARPQTSSPPQVRRRARRGLHPKFVAFASFVIVLLVIGVVALNALFAQTTFAVHSMQQRVVALQDQRDVLANEEARLSAPGQIALWASRYHMVVPTDVVILHARGGDTRGTP